MQEVKQTSFKVEKEHLFANIQFQRLKHTFDHLKKINSGGFQSTLARKAKEKKVTPTEYLEQEQIKTNEEVHTYIFQLKENSDLKALKAREEFKQKIKNSVSQDEGVHESDSYVHKGILKLDLIEKCML